MGTLIIAADIKNKMSLAFIKRLLSSATGRDDIGSIGRNSPLRIGRGALGRIIRRLHAIGKHLVAEVFGSLMPVAGWSKSES
jgi:hypothetical protein